MNDLLEAIEKQNRAIVEFKSTVESRIVDLERRDARRNGPLNGGFGNESQSSGLFLSDSPETRAFRYYLRTGNATELKSLTTAVGSDGGFSVPKEISDAIESLVLAQSPIRQYATVQPTETGDFHKLVSLGGFGASWAAETAARPATATGTFADLAPPSGDLQANPQATQWMIDDSLLDLATWLIEAVGDQFALMESQAFISGDGTVKPKGFLSYTNVTTDDASRAFGSIQYVPTGAAGAFATVSATVSPYDVLLATVAKMKVGYRKEARWFMSPATLATLAQVKDTVGRHILIPPLTEGAPPMLVGYPVTECEDMPAITANSFSIAFANMRRAYLITDRHPGTRVLVDPYTNKPFTGYYCVRRTGGCVQNSEAIKLIKFAVS